MLLAKALENWVAEGGRPKAQLRGARRLPMYEKALEPVRGRLSAADFQSLLLALSVASTRKLTALPESSSRRSSAGICRPNDGR